MVEIDLWMEHIWLKVIKAEYDQSRILEECNLHSTVYFYFRPGEYPAPWGEGFCPLWSLIPRCLRRGSSFKKISRKFENQENETVYILRDALLNHKGW